MPNIYEISNWATSTLYEKDAIVLKDNIYYYAKLRHTSGTFATDVAAGRWGGTVTISGQTKPFFYWTPSYGYSLDIEPRVKTIQFGDSYAQILADGINNILLPFDIEFNDRSLSEFTAITHFFHARGGYQEFYFIPPSPYNVLKKFTCPRWNSTQTAYEKYNIRASLKEKI